MKDFKELFFATGLIPVIKIESVHMADGLASALLAGGSPLRKLRFERRPLLRSSKKSLHRIKISSLGPER